MGSGLRALRLLLLRLRPRRLMPGPAPAPAPAPGEEGPKRLRRAMAPRIGTHNGTFHCDEALACYLLRLLPQYRDAEIIRTREPQLLSECDVVVDVGGEYDPQKHRYDHHQRSFAQSMHCLRPDKPWQTKLSSAGLVYFHFGSQILASLLDLKEEDPVVQVLYDKLYENFVEEIDAIDNGIAQWDEKPRYAITTNLSTRVGYLNPRWNDSDQDTEDRFQKAMELVGGEFLDRLDYYHRSWLPARTLVEDAIQKRFEDLQPRDTHQGVKPATPLPPHEVDPSGEILMFSQGGCPWKEHLFSLESELGVEKPIKFVLYADQNGRWRVQCVPAELHSFQSRLPLLEEWRGVRDEALSQLSGIPGCVFVHASGFIGGNRSQEGALRMAQRTLAQQAGPDAPSG